MARVLGLDLGSHAVKGVLFETSMRGYQTRLAVSVRRAQEGDRTETLKAALTELFTQHPVQADQVVVALPGPTLATHVVTLPFSDPRKIEQTLPFEIEGQLPYDISEVVFDYQVASTKDKKSDILVGLVRKTELKALIDTLAELKLTPKVITHPGIAYQNVLATMSAAEVQDGAIAIVDIGHERTSIAIGSPGGPVEVARTFSGGGKDLTRTLAREFQVPPLDAEKWKEQHGALASHINGPDAERAAGAFIRGMQGVVRELRQSFKAYSARSRRPVMRVYICGGTATMPGFDEQLASDLSIPVERLALPNEAAAQIGQADLSRMAQPFALALRGFASGAKAPRFNLRRGEFGFKGDFDYVRDKIPRIAAFAFTLLLLIIASGMVRNFLLAEREEKVDAELCETTKKILGTCEKSYDRALAMLQGTESPAAAVPKVSAVQLLSDLTQRIPQDANVTLQQVEVQLDRITLRAETESTKQVDAVTTELKKHRCFKEVQQRKVDRQGERVTFGLDILVECPAEGSQTPQG